MIVKNAARVIKHDQHCMQPLLSLKKGALTRRGGGGGVLQFQNLADTRGAYSEGALIRGQALIREFTVAKFSETVLSFAVTALVTLTVRFC